MSDVDHPHAITRPRRDLLLVTAWHLRNRLAVGVAPDDVAALATDFRAEVPDGLDLRVIAELIAPLFRNLQRFLRCHPLSLDALFPLVEARHGFPAVMREVELRCPASETVDGFDRV